MFPRDGPRALSLVRKLWLHKLPRRQQRRKASSSQSSGQVEPKAGGLGPVLSSAVTCGAFSLLSDTLVQGIELKAPRGQSDEVTYDPARAARMTGFGLLFYGPLQRFWYALLDRQFNRRTHLPHFASKVRRRREYLLCFQTTHHHILYLQKLMLTIHWHRWY